MLDAEAKERQAALLGRLIQRPPRIGSDRVASERTSERARDSHGCCCCLCRWNQLCRPLVGSAGDKNMPQPPKSEFGLEEKEEDEEVALMSFEFVHSATMRH